MLPKAGGDGGSGRGSAGRGQRAAPPQGPLGAVVRQAASHRLAAWSRHRRNSTSHHAPRLQFSAQEAWFSRTGPAEPTEFTPARLPLHTQLRSPRSPRQSRLSHSRPRGLAAASLARQLGRANCVIPSERPRPSPVRLPPPAPAPAPWGWAPRAAGLRLFPRGPHRQERAHTAPLRGGPALAGLNPSPASGVPVARSAKPHGSGAREATHNRAVLSAGQRGGRRARARRYSLTAAASECIFVQRCTRCRPGSCPAPNPEPGHGHPRPAHCPRPLVRAAGGCGESRPLTG